MLPQKFTDSLTGLHQCYSMDVRSSSLPHSQDPDTIAIYASSMTKIGCFLFNRNALQSVEFLLLDDIHGCEPNCSCINTHNELVGIAEPCEADFGGR